MDMRYEMELNHIQICDEKSRQSRVSPGKQEIDIFSIPGSAIHDCFCWARRIANVLEIMTM